MPPTSPPTDQPTPPSLWIEWIPISVALGKQARENPKEHDLSSIKDSIERFGYAELGVLDEASGRMVSGHGRLEALAELQDEGAERPDSISVNGDGEWLIPFIRGKSFANENEARAFLVASNQLTTKGGWNEAALTRILKEQADRGIENLKGTGFDQKSLAGLLKKWGADGTNEEPSRVDFSEKVIEQWMVVITCDGEHHQKELLDRFQSEGLSVKALVS